MRYSLLGLLLNIILISVAPSKLSAQKGNFARSATVGSSYTYIFDRRMVDVNTFSRYHEFTWNTNIAIEVLPKWYLGFAYMDIRTYSTRNRGQRGKHNMTSIFSQYDIFTHKSKRFFAEAAYSYGNFCTCGLKDPYKLSGLNYLGLGAGVELPLYKKLKLDIAFSNHVILQDVKRKYNFTQYVVGLNYRFGKQL
jgi:hypothetical protein